MSALFWFACGFAKLGYWFRMGWSFKQKENVSVARRTSFDCIPVSRLNACLYLLPAAFILGYSYSWLSCLSVLSKWPRRCQAQRIHPTWPRISQWIPLRTSLGPCLDPVAPIFGYGHLPQNLLRLYWKTVGSLCRLN